MTHHMRGIRSMPFRIMETIDAGRDLEGLVQDTKRDGLVYTVPVLRNAVLGGRGIRRKKTAETVVVVGCACYGTLDAVMSGFRLL
ncbi:MAG: hypothetical protein QGI79_04655, partial [Dehalococcoidia bacterium]|nr:hypothetical protein [Dehalococcoidia bacterium]